MIDRQDSEQGHVGAGRAGAALGPTGRVVAEVGEDGPTGFEVTNRGAWRTDQERERCLRDRLRAAMVNSALPWHGGTIRLDVTGWGGGYGPDAELAIAVAVLRAEGVTIGTPSDRFRGAVRLDGQVSEGERCSPVDALWDLGALR